MIKAKTKGRIVTILCAILSAVFAFCIGFTYCASLFTFNYGSNELSTTAYMANNQYVLINDTLTSPVAFGKGSHNFEIALKYAIDYSFDFRIDYSLQWLNADGTNSSVSTENVILNFANRDNLIVDENHIYYVQYDNEKNPTSVAAGDGKITIITGISYVDVEDEKYNGLYLTINADVEISPKTETYSSEHNLVKNISSSESAKAWLQYKNCRNANVWKDPNNAAITKDAYVMLYNYRYDYNHGVPFPGGRTAYKKTIENSKVADVKWLGGNRAYAGTGMYVITGANDVKLKVKVKGVWQTEEDLGMFENSVKFNYTNKWVSLGVDDVNVIHETTAFSFVIPAYTACYIEILDSIEVVSAGAVTSNKYDSHRAIINSIEVNHDSDLDSGLIDYTLDGNNKYIHSFMVKYNPELNYTNNNKTGSYNPTADYTADTITVKNNSEYANNLYEIGTEGASQQTYYTNLTLINNTAEEKVVSGITYNLQYRISNGNTGVYGTDETPSFEGGNYYAIKDVIEYGETYGVGEGEEEENFTYNSIVNVDKAKTNIIIAPYSSVNVCEIFEVTSNFTRFITKKCEGVYDVWVQLIPNFTLQGSSSVDGLTLNVTHDGTNAVVSLKNNTNSILSGISISDLSLRGIEDVTEDDYDFLEKEPNDFKSSFWKYYEKDENNNMVRVEAYPTKTIIENGSDKVVSAFEDGEYYQLNVGYENISITYDVSDLSLNPGDSYEIATIATTKKQFILTGNAVATTKQAATDAMLIKNGTSSAYITNESETNSYYVRIKGQLSNPALNWTYKDDGYTYYIGVLRPKQILSVPVSNEVEFDAVLITDTVFKESDLTGWNDDAVKDIGYIFSRIKKVIS